MTSVPSGFFAFKRLSATGFMFEPSEATATPPNAAFGGQTGAFGGVAVASDGSNINPVALNLLNAKNPDGTLVIPSPQTTGSGVNYTAVLPGHYNEDQFNTNFDVKLRTADRLSVKFFFSNSNQDVPFFGASVPGFPALRSFGNRILSITETHLLSPQTINQFRFGFSRLAGQSVAGGNGTTLSNIFFSGVVAGTPDVGERASAAHLFALDDWKATRTLTINLGVRVEVNGQQSEVEGRESNFYPQFYVPPPAGGFTDPISSGFVLPDNYHGYAPAGFPRTNSTLLNHPIELHPQPRISFACRPFSSKDFALRRGYGIYANRTSFAGNGELPAFTPPFTFLVSITVAPNPAPPLPTPFPPFPPNSSF